MSEFKIRCSITVQVLFHIVGQECEAKLGQIGCNECSTNHGPI